MNLESRIERFRQKGLGLFVHYGPYVQYQHGEWTLNLRQMDPAVYESKALCYDYSCFDAENIIKAAKACGARYVTFTARHHDGFSLYDTRGLSDYDIMHTPNGRDIVKEFCDACHANGIMPFLYHTTLDWHHPDFTENFDRYQDYLKASIEILCRNYGEIGGFWLDGNWSMPADVWDLDGLYSVIRRYQPDAIIINNTGLEAQGVLGHREIDCVTFEQGRPQKLDCSALERLYMGEMCYPLCEHWGIADDINIKSMRQILEAMIACRAVGANFLLGIFTKPDGTQPLLHAGYLQAIGQWIDQHKAAFFEASPCEITGFGKDFALRKGNTCYLFIHDVGTWGDANVLKTARREPSVFENFSLPVKSARWMEHGEPVRYSQDLDQGLLVVDPLPFTYGESRIVRVAELELERG